MGYFIQRLEFYIRKNFFLRTFMAALFVFAMGLQPVSAITYQDLANSQAMAQSTGRVLGASTFTVQVVNTTNTQAVLSYTAPDANPCSIQVSENSSLSPLAHDVDPALFAGSDMDNRADAVFSGTKRIFIVGKRVSQKASDGLVYSRSLQAYTTHYYKITCGTAVGSGTFTTANIPSGMTYQDIPQVDNANPGQWVMPSFVEDRNQKINDPQTGALLRRVSIDADKAGSISQGLFLSFGAFVRNCANKLQTDPNGTQGYLCIFFQGGGFGKLFFIVPSTGEARPLGAVNFGYPSIDNSMNIFGDDGNGNLYRYTYTGNFVANGTNILSNQILYGTTAIYNQMIKNFDSSFDPSLFSCALKGAEAGAYTFIQCGRGYQDSYGWLAVLYGGDGRPLDPNCTAGSACPRIVAAANIISDPETRWCSLHNVQMVPGYPLISINFQEMKDFSGLGMGLAPQATKLTNAIASNQSTITVDGQPASLNTSDTFRQNFAVGDVFYIGQNPQEKVTITGITQQPNGTIDLQVTHSNPQPFPAGTPVYGACKAGFNMGYWKFLNDAHAQDTTNNNMVIDYYWGGGGHQDYGPLGRVEEGWYAVYGNVINNLNVPLSLTIDPSPKFAGVLGAGYGSSISQHPSYHQDSAQTTLQDQQWFLDMTPFDGGNLFSDNPGSVLVSGQLYKYIPYSALPINRKQLASIASNGGKALVDISGPNSQISDKAADSYKYCVANVAGECRTGSSPGDIFVNAPGVNTLQCSGGDGPNPLNSDICVANMPTYAQAMDQIYLSPSGSTAEATARSRVITHGMAGIKVMFGYSAAKSLPDGSWALFPIDGTSYGQNINVWMAKLPPFVQSDNVDRSTFIRTPISITPPSGQGIASAAVEFGYYEQGAPSQHYCTSRRESCLATSLSINDSNPFTYSQTESSALMPCGTSCTITLPVLPVHTAYYQVKYYNASGAFLGNGDQGVAMEAAVASISGGNTITPPSDTTPPVISSISSSAINGSGATIGWTTDEPSDSQVDYGTSTSYNSSSSLNTSLALSHSISLSSLLPSTLYHYRVKSRDAAGNLGVSGDQTFTTTAGTSGDTTPPSAPSNLTATGVASTQVNLTWAGSTDNVGVAGYRIYRGGTQIATTPNLFYSDMGLTPSTTYTYTIAAYDAAGNVSAQSFPGPATTLSALPSISNLISSNTTANSTQLSWNTNTPTNGQVFYGLTSAYGQQSSLVDNTTKTASHAITLSGLTAATLYHFKVTSVDAGGNSVSSADFTFTTNSVVVIAPPTISTFTATPSSIPAGGSSVLSWTASGADTLSIDNLVGTVTGTSKTVTPSTTTLYTLTAVNAGGTVTSQATVVVTSGGSTPTTTPPTIASFTASPNSIVFGQSSLLSWSVSGNPAPVITINQGLGSQSGSSQNVTPTQTTTYTLTATNSAGSASAQAAVNVSSSSTPGSGTQPIVVYIPPAAEIPPLPGTGPASSSQLRLVNQNGTFYLIQDGIKHGITNPEMLTSYGFSLNDAIAATADDQSLPDGSILLPSSGALVKSTLDKTVYLISQGQRFGFTSAQVFLALGFKFSSVLVVTDPELQALPKADSLLSDGNAAHLAGLDINRQGTIYWVGDDFALHAYSSLSDYNSWHIDNDFSRVVNANSADLVLPVGSNVAARILQ